MNADFLLPVLPTLPKQPRVCNRLWLLSLPSWARALSTLCSTQKVGGKRPGSGASGKQGHRHQSPEHVHGVCGPPRGEHGGGSQDPESLRSKHFNEEQPLSNFFIYWWKTQHRGGSGNTSLHRGAARTRMRVSRWLCINNSTLSLCARGEERHKTKRSLELGLENV